MSHTSTEGLVPLHFIRIDNTATYRLHMPTTGGMDIKQAAELICSSGLPGCFPGGVMRVATEEEYRAWSPPTKHDAAYPL